MKQNSLGTKILMALVTLGVVGYFAIQAAQYLSDPLTTAIAYAYEVEEGVDLSGYVVRREQVLADDANGSLRLRRAEGERVSAGGVVAAVYADQAALDRQSQIEQLQDQVEQLRYAQEAALGSEASLKLDVQIVQHLLDYRQDLAAERLYDAEKAGDELRALVLKRDYTHSDTEDIAAEIQTLQEQLKTLRSQSANSIRTVRAPVSGLYSAVVDGYEAVLTPERLPELTPSQLAAVRPDETVQSKVGKLVLGDEWYYAAAMSTRDAEQLAEDGGVYLQFAKSVERELPVTVDSIGPEENGRVVVTFRSTSYLPQMTLLRQQSAQAVRTTYSGIRVPKEALRAARFVQNEDGTQTVEETLGIYCVVGVEARFKPVEVLYNGDGFVLVQAVETGSETTRLRPGDTVIITAKDLFDGKVLS